MSAAKGNNGVLFLDQQLNWSRGGGLNWNYVYSGPQSAVLSQASALISSGNVDEVQAGKIGNGPRFGLVARFGDSDILNTDELLSNEIQQSIFQSPKLRGLIPASVIASILSSLQLVKSGQKTYSVATGDITAACLAAGIGNGNALAVFDDALQERDTYYTSAYVYRRTYTVSSRGALAAAFSNIDKVHTTQQVRAAESTPTSFPLPDGFWLKKAPHALTALRQKTQLVYEYQWALDFNSNYYDFVAATP